MRKEERQEWKSLGGAEPGGGFEPPVTLDGPFLGAVPDITEILHFFGIRPLQRGEIAGNGGVFFDPGAEEFDAMFGQPVPVDSEVGQKSAESFDLVEGFFQAVLGRDRPSGEAGGSGGNQELDAPSEGSFRSWIHFPREVPESRFDFLVEVLQDTKKRS